MGKFLYFSFIIFIFFNSCKEDITSPQFDFASIKIKVFSENNYPIDSAIVIIKGTNYQSITDSMGIAEFKNIPVGKYQIIAYVKELGSGQKLTEIKNGSNEVSIVFRFNIYYEPTIIVDSGYPFATNDTVSVRCVIRDNFSPNESLKVDFYFRNNLIQSGHPDAFGYITLVAPNLPQGIDTILVTATNLDSVSSSQYFSINKTRPFRVKLQLQSVIDGIIELKWNASKDSNFFCYVVQQEGYSDFYDKKIIYDVNTTSFIDSATSFYDKVSYRIQTRNINVYDPTSSNILSIDYPNGKTFHLITAYTLIHPTLPYLYLFESYYISGNSRILKYNYETREVEAETVTDQFVHYPSIRFTKRGLELAVPSENGNVYLYNGDNLSLKKTIYTVISPISVELTEDGFLFVSHNNGLWSYDGDSGTRIDSTYYFARPYHMLKFSSQDKIFGYAGNELYLIDIDKQGHILSYTRTNSQSYLYEYVYSFSNSENYAILNGFSEVYKINPSINYVDKLPFIPSASKATIFNDNDDLIFTANDEQSRIRCFDFPSFNLSKVIKTKGIPYRLFFRNGELISITALPNWTTTFGIEKFKIN